MLDLSQLGSDWLAGQVNGWTDEIVHVDPVSYNEEFRYLPESAGPMPGYIDFSVNPFMREILMCADPRSDVREVNLKKGVQITYTTLLESVLFYYIGYIKTRPTMMVSADKELVKGRIENYILPMLQQSGLGHLIRSSDEGNSRKTGQTANHLQWEGGGFLVPGGANNADKMRMWSIFLMLEDEIDGWPDIVGKDGDPVALLNGRCSAFWDDRKIFRGSTPLLKGSSKIGAQYLRGDQREYLVLCRACSFPQKIKWGTTNKETGVVGGFTWEMEERTLIAESVRYHCQDCGHAHYEFDKTKLLAEEEGAHWHPTARPVAEGIRSYHLPAMYSPVGMQPWHKCVAEYLEGWDYEQKRVRDIGKYQVFYNNILGEEFEVRGSKVKFETVSAHRRQCYKFGEIPNEHAKEFAGSKILFLTCQVDVHKKNLAVAVFGWTTGSRNYLIDYWRFEVEGDDDDCSETSSPVWGRLRELIEEKRYTAPDGTQYRVLWTGIDAGYANDTVTTFTRDYGSGVYPILGRDRPSKNQTIKEFGEFKTQSGNIGYKFVVDHYKDRMAYVLRREWFEDSGEQKEYHFNAPLNVTDRQLKELTVEVRREEKDSRGNSVYPWYRPGNARNELWDLLGYGFAAVEVIAWTICVKHFELETVDWDRFWSFAAENDEMFGRYLDTSVNSP